VGTPQEHTVIFQPGIGYFLSDRWEVTLQPQFTLTASSYNYTGTYWNGSLPQYYEVHFRHREYFVQILAGIYYHMPLSESMFSFVGTSAGLSSSKDIIETSGGPDPPQTLETYWSKPTVFYPSLSAGLKIFASGRWAVSPQLQLAFKSVPTNPLYEKEFVVLFGAGFMVYLNNGKGS
jgi:hypothetical protein